MGICRACLVADNCMSPLDETFIESYNLLTNLNVTMQDGMPQTICPNCGEMVRSFIEFREKSILSETTLRKCIKSKNEYLGTEDKLVLSLKQEVKVENDLDTIDNFIEALDANFDYEEPLLSIKKEEVPVKPRKNAERIKTRKKKKNPDKSVVKNRGTKLKTHASETSDVKILLCGVCTKKFDDTVNLKNHLRTHMKYRECEICHERFSAWPGLLAHRLEHIPKKQGHCHLCPKRYVSSAYLEYHFLTAHNDGQPMALRCKICLRTYKTPGKLQKHNSTSHAETKFLCDCCSKGFICKANLISHLKSRDKLKRYVCHLCGYRCTQRQNLKAHELRRHSPNAVTCKTCHGVFPTQEKCDAHTCKTKQVACPECGKLVLSNILACHRRCHKAASYKCSRCPAVYKTRGALRVHEDRHDDVRRLQCTYCPAKFFSHSVLLKHKRIHTGEKPYVCNICSKAFTGRGNLKVHMKVHGLFLVVKKGSIRENINDIFKEGSST